MRIPAACCGLFGFKASWGVVSNSAPTSPVTHVGPLTRTVRDGAIVMDVIQRVPAESEHNSATLSAPHDFDFLGQCDLQRISNDVSKLRVGVSLSLGNKIN